LKIFNVKLGFTLIEIIIVIIIVGLLATFALPQYIRTQEKALDNEARANLVLIQAAENIYNTESGSFYASSVHSDLNSNLSIALPPAGGKWNYSTVITPAAGVVPAKVCARATRNGGDARTWTLMDTCTTPFLGVCTPC